MLARLPPDAPPEDQPLADLAQVLAHRMRGPLTSIQCYTEMLADTAGAAAERDLVLRIFESVAALERTLADLHRYSFSIAPVPRALEARRLMEDVLTGLGDAREHVALDVPDDVVVQADPLLLQQALLILLENALDAARAASEPAGGRGEGPAVRCSVRCSVRREHAAGSAEPPGVRFEVWNAGALDLDEARAFSPFCTTKSSNLGIGLAMARRIASAHGGSLQLTTRGAAGADTGVTFTLLLPPPANYTD